MLVLPALALVFAALLGYLLGHRPARPVAHETTLTASVAGVLLQVPGTWQSVPLTQEVPGLSLRRAVVFSPQGNPARAGLIAGELPSRQPSPLPASFIARLRQLPSTAVVELQESQAYRYTKLASPGFDKNLAAVYVVPNPGGDPTALACYSAAGQAAETEACQRIVATLTLAGRTQSYDLTPQAEYAQHLSATIATLDARRSVLRPQMSAHASAARLQKLAEDLAGAFAQAGASLGTLEPTAITGSAQSALASAVLQAHSAYRSLAQAAAGRDQATYSTARSQVENAELEVNSALQNFALLGYQQG
jgi:hypothetical protein